MALSSIQGSDLGTLLGSMNGGGSVRKGSLSGIDVPRMKPQGSDKSKDVGEGRAVGRRSARVQVETMQVRMLFEATIKASRGVSGLSGGRGAGPDFAAQMASIMAGHSEAFQPDETGIRPIDRLAAEFTPEKTAERIAGFALSWYGQWLDGREDSTEVRAEFAEYIGAAVQKGFDEAAAILGVLPENTQAGIDQTHEMVFDALENFVENGARQSGEHLASLQAAGLAFNATFGSYNDSGAMMDEMLNRLETDGSLRLDDLNLTAAPGALIDVAA